MSIWRSSLTMIVMAVGGHVLFPHGPLMNIVDQVMFLIGAIGMFVESIKGRR